MCVLQFLSSMFSTLNIYHNMYYIVLSTGSCKNLTGLLQLMAKAMFGNVNRHTISNYIYNKSQSQNPSLPYASRFCLVFPRVIPVFSLYSLFPFLV